VNERVHLVLAIDCTAPPQLVAILVVTKSKLKLLCTTITFLIEVLVQKGML
jgi:hypothetical protein